MLLEAAALPTHAGSHRRLQARPLRAGDSQQRAAFCVGAPQLSGNTNKDSTRNLKLCAGDCDSDVQCAAGLNCFKRDGDEAVPGCMGSGQRKWDYCYKPPTQQGASFLPLPLPPSLVPPPPATRPGVADHRRGCRLAGWRLIGSHFVGGCARLPSPGSRWRSLTWCPASPACLRRLRPVWPRGAGRCADQVCWLLQQRARQSAPARPH